ncbi:hypothetical protein ACFPRL_07795 [Pseudoclavibacter helvolus]
MVAEDAGVEGVENGARRPVGGGLGVRARLHHEVHLHARSSLDHDAVA